MKILIGYLITVFIIALISVGAFAICRYLGIGYFSTGMVVGVLIGLGAFASGEIILKINFIDN